MEKKFEQLEQHKVEDQDIAQSLMMKFMEEVKHFQSNKSFMTKK